MKNRNLQETKSKQSIENMQSIDQTSKWQPSNIPKKTDKQKQNLPKYSPQPLIKFQKPPLPWNFFWKKSINTGGCWLVPSFSHNYTNIKKIKTCHTTATRFCHGPAHQTKLQKRVKPGSTQPKTHQTEFGPHYLQNFFDRSKKNS